MTTPPFQSVTVPAARPDQASRRAHDQLIAKARAGGIDLYFLGDSITRRWGCTDPEWAELLTHWRETFFGWNAGNFGWGGDQVQHMRWRIEHGELEGVHPRVIVILAGTNNIGNEPAPDAASRAAKVADILTGYDALLNACRRHAPGAKLIITAIFPRNDNPAVLPEVSLVNAGLARFARDHEAFFLDVNDRLADADGVLFDGVAVDGLHLSLRGYQVWADGLTPLLRDLLGPPSDSDHAPPPTGIPC